MLRIAVLLLALATPGALAADTFRCRAIDGDTLHCGAERVRLRGIHAPELREPGGVEARDRLARLVAGAEVRLVRHGRDRWGRTRADVWVGGRRITQADIGQRGGLGLRR